MESVRKMTCFVNGGAEQVVNLFGVFGVGIISRRQAGIQHTAHQRRARKVLAQAVVQFLGYELLRAFADPQNLLL